MRKKTIESCEITKQKKMIGNNKNKFATDLLIGRDSRVSFHAFSSYAVFRFVQSPSFCFFLIKHTPLTAQQTPVNINSIQL